MISFKWSIRNKKFQNRFRPCFSLIQFPSVLSILSRFEILYKVHYKLFNKISALFWHQRIRKSTTPLVKLKVFMISGPCTIYQRKHEVSSSWSFRREHYFIIDTVFSFSCIGIYSTYSSVCFEYISWRHILSFIKIILQYMKSKASISSSSAWNKEWSYSYEQYSSNTENVMY